MKRLLLAILLGPGCAVVATAEEPPTEPGGRPAIAQDRRQQGEAYRSMHAACTRRAEDLPSDASPSAIHELATRMAAPFPPEARPRAYAGCRDGLTAALERLRSEHWSRWFLDEEWHGLRFSVIFGMLLGIFYARRLENRTTGTRRLAAALLVLGGAAVGGATYVACYIFMVVASWFQERSQWEVLLASVFLQAIGAWHLTSRWKHHTRR